MFSGEHSANDISSELFIGGSRRHMMGHHRVILRSNSSSKAEVSGSPTAKDSCEEVRTRQVPSPNKSPKKDLKLLKLFL
jgi:hypothetical protein